MNLLSSPLHSRGKEFYGISEFRQSPREREERERVRVFWFTLRKGFFLLVLGDARRKIGRGDLGTARFVRWVERVAVGVTRSLAIGVELNQHTVSTKYR